MAAGCHRETSSSHVRGGSRRPARPDGHAARRQAGPGPRWGPPLDLDRIRRRGDRGRHAGRLGIPGPCLGPRVRQSGDGEGPRPGRLVGKGVARRLPERADPRREGVAGRETDPRLLPLSGEAGRAHRRRTGGSPQRDLRDESPLGHLGTRARQDHVHVRPRRAATDLQPEDRRRSGKGRDALEGLGQLDNARLLVTRREDPRVRHRRRGLRPGHLAPGERERAAPIRRGPVPEMATGHLPRRALAPLLLGRTRALRGLRQDPHR